MGANSPERCRLEAMIWVTPRAIAGSGSPLLPMKSGSAIGIGWTLPRVMSSLTAASARCGNRPVSAPAAVPAPSTIRRRRLSASGDIEVRVTIVVLG